MYFLPRNLTKTVRTEFLWFIVTLRGSKKESWRDPRITYRSLSLSKFQDSFVWNSESAPKQREEEALGMSMNHVAMGRRATAANQDLALETGMSETLIRLFVS